MTSLPTGEVRLYMVLEWAQEQAVHLSPTQHHVLLYLCINAFRTFDNPEGREPGDVLTGRNSLIKIQMGTGLSQTAVKRALHALQDACYIKAQHSPGNGHSRVAVYWSEPFDVLRDEVRAGRREPPAAFKRATKPRLGVVREDATVVPFKGRA